MSKEARFNIGDIVLHKKQGYRAVIVDIDPLFQASGRYNPQVLKKGFEERKPWYRLLVDESTQMTYVEEQLLLPDDSTRAIKNPSIDDFLTLDHGEYQSLMTHH